VTLAPGIQYNTIYNDNRGTSIKREPQFVPQREEKCESLLGLANLKREKWKAMGKA
jgi:hypothetical protein